MTGKRILKMSGVLFALAAVAVGAVLLYKTTGIGFPCVLYEVTGLKCPGCGNTHAVMALMKFDIKGAVASNAMAIPEFAFVFYVFVKCAVRYIKTGFFAYDSKVSVLDVSALVIFCLWGVVRNIIKM